SAIRCNRARSVYDRPVWYAKRPVDGHTVSPVMDRAYTIDRLCLAYNHSWWMEHRHALTLGEVPRPRQAASLKADVDASASAPEVRSRGLMGAQAYETLRAAIVDGTHSPQTRLKEAELADALGVWRTPVREAIRQLELDGLVRVSPNRSAV